MQTTARAPDLETRRQAVAGIELFRIMDPAQRDSVLSQASLQRYERNAAVMRRGESASCMVVILQGNMRVSVLSAEGHEVSLGVMGPGDMLGEMALLDGRPRSADVTAVGACVVLVIQRADFLQMLRSSTDLCLRLIEILSRRVREANSLLEEVATQDLQTRLAKLLLRLAESYGQDVAGRTRINMKLTQKDLSSLVMGSREKVNRQLRRWETQGVVANDHGYLTIRNRSALMAESPG